MVALSRAIDYLFRANVVFRAISYRYETSHRREYCLDCDFPIFRSLAGEGFRFSVPPGNTKFPQKIARTAKVLTPMCFQISTYRAETRAPRQNHKSLKNWPTGAKHAVSSEPDLGRSCAPLSGFRSVAGKCLGKTTPEFEYRCKARRLLNKHHTVRRRPNASHHRVLVWTEILAPQVGICSALHPINITRNLYDDSTVT